MPTPIVRAALNENPGSEPRAKTEFAEHEPKRDALAPLPKAGG